MTDRDLVLKRLAFVETCVQQLRSWSPPAEGLERSIKDRRFVEHTLQIAIQAALDVASHIVSDERLGEPPTNRALFELLVTARWLPQDLGAVLADMASFRNVLVHGYAEVDLAIVRDIVDNHLPDLEAFVGAVRERL